MDDLTAVRQLKKGDINALQVLVERYQTEAVRSAYLITGDKALADDAMQEAFLRAYRYIEQFDEQRPFVPWFMRIVANCAIQSAKRQSRTVSLDADINGEDADTFLERLPDLTPSPDDTAEASETRQLVWAALEQLPPEQRAAIVLRYYFDFSERELAEALSTSQGTVSWRLSTARKRLGTILSPIFRQQSQQEA